MNNSHYSQLIIKALIVEAKQLDKPIAWFQYAKKNKKTSTYRFLANKRAQIMALERLAARLHRKLPELLTGQIIDVLSEYVNAV